MAEPDTSTAGGGSRAATVRAIRSVPRVRLSQDLALAGRRPALVPDARAGQVHHRVDAVQARGVDRAGGRVPPDGARGRGTAGGRAGAPCGRRPAATASRADPMRPVAPVTATVLLAGCMGGLLLG